jgi:glyoxylase-like metal-dependent hydrolase (beta-lactamase superfamily II)
MSDSDITQIADDIVQARIPLPYKLNSVNCYLLRGADGWTLIDTGLNTAAARAQWKAARQALDIRPEDIKKIVLTHMHPDHFGMAGWWQRQAKTPAPLFLPERERRQMQAFYRRQNTPLYHKWMLDCGMDAESVDHIEQALFSTRDSTRPHPVQQSFLRADATVRLGEREFRTIHAPGHSDGQMIFYDAADRLMLSGDHVLMRITPNIGSWPHSEPDPLGRYLGSLRELAALDVRLALPGHKWLITDWRGRIEELIAHHQQRLEHTQDAIQPVPRTVLQVAAQLFDLERLTPHEWRFALAETLAHLNYLLEREQATRLPAESNEATRWIASET